MNETTLIQLKIIVERSVRPVRASTSRKRKMREELLAHVSGVFEVELAQLGDEQIALDRTAQRFGNVADVTSQLQESVPASDGIARFWEGRPEESTLRGALRLAWVTAAIVLVLGGTAWIASAGVSESLREEMTIFVAGLAFLAAWLFGIAFVTHSMEKWLHGPERLTGWPHVGLIKSFTAAWSVPAVRVALVIGVLCQLLLLVTTWSIPFENWVFSTMVLAGLLFAGDVAATSVLVAWVMVQSADERRRYHDEWANLPIA